MTLKAFGPSLEGSYPPEMRRQLWPLCCGASILSGFKDVHVLTEDDLVAKINETIDQVVPDLQVFKTETMRPQLTFLTLNQSQCQSEKIMASIKRAGFVKFAEGKPRGAVQSFFVQDKTKTFKVNELS